jgi:hypothetical protein
MDKEYKTPPPPPYPRYKKGPWGFADSWLKFISVKHEKLEGQRTRPRYSIRPAIFLSMFCALLAA